MIRTRITPFALALLAGAPLAHAQATTIAEWNFRSMQTGLSTNGPAPTTALRPASAQPLGMTNNYTYANGVTGSVATCDLSGTPNSSDPPAWRIRGTSPGNGWNLAAPQYSQGAQFNVSTVGFSDIRVTFDWFSTSNGVRNLQLQYTTDGSTWTSAGPLNVAVPNAYAPTITVDLGALGVTAAANNPSFGVRFVSAYDPTYTGADAPQYTSATLTQGQPVKYNNQSGNWRFGIVTVKGTALQSIAPQVAASASPRAVCVGGGQTLITAAVQPGLNPASVGLTVTANLSSVGGSSSQSLYDDGTHGDATPGDGVWSFLATIPTGTPAGAKSIPVTAADQAQPASGQPAPRSATSNASFTVADCSQNSASRVVIAQVFGGGGNLGPPAAPFNADYAVLFNRSAQTVDLTGWSLQYAGPVASNGFNSVSDQVLLAGDIKPGQKLLVRLSDPGPVGSPLPTPDFTNVQGFGGIGNNGGRLALVRSSTLILNNCADPSVEDFVGYGPAVCFEGAAPTPSPGNDTAVFRALSGAQDTNQNFNDFTLGAPLPANRTDGGFLAGYPASVNAATCAGSTETFTVAVTPAPSSSNIQVRANLTALGGGASVPLLDNGAGPDQTAGDAVFTLAHTIPASLTPGLKTITFTTTDAQGRTDTSRLSVSVGTCTPSSAPVVISMVFGGGGNTGAAYNADFVELFNRSAAPVDLTGWSLQYADVTNLGGFNANELVPLSGSIPPGGYRLIVTNTPSTNPSSGVPVGAADFTPARTFGMDNHYGYVALVNSTTPLGNTFPSPAIIDFVGYGASAARFEGTGPTASLSNQLLAVRKQNGCQDFDQNAIDFDVIYGTFYPRSSSTTPAPCASPATGACCTGTACALASGTLCPTGFQGPGSVCGPANNPTTCCPANHNGSNGVDLLDIFAFLNDWFSGNLRADFNRNNAVDLLDIFGFLTAWFTGC